MPLVNVLVNGHAYTVACDEGEEEHLRALAKFVDGRVRQLVETVGQVGDARLLLMAGLVIADELSETMGRLEERDKEMATLKSAPANKDNKDKDKDKGPSTEEALADALEKATRQIEDIAQRLGRA